MSDNTDQPIEGQPLPYTKTTDSILDIIDTGDKNRYAVALRLTQWHETELKRAVLEARLNLVDYFDQPPTNNTMDWKGLFADSRDLLQTDLEELNNAR